MTRLATDRSRLIDAHSRIHIAYVELNRVLNRPQEDLFEADPPSLVDPGLITGFGRLNRYVDNAASFTLFKEFMVEEGLTHSPELRAIDSAIAAQSRQKLAARRSFWAPDLSLIADLEQRMWRGGVDQVDDRNLPPRVRVCHQFQVSRRCLRRLAGQLDRREARADLVQRGADALLDTLGDVHSIQAQAVELLGRLSCVGLA